MVSYAKYRICLNYNICWLVINLPLWRDLLVSYVIWVYVTPKPFVAQCFNESNSREFWYYTSAYFLNNLKHIHLIFRCTSISRDCGSIWFKVFSEIVRNHLAKFMLLRNLKLWRPVVLNINVFDKTVHTVNQLTDCHFNCELLCRNMLRRL